MKHPLLSRIDFGNEAGDDVEFAELIKYFHEQPQFSAMLRDDRRLMVASARKGVGKSALLRWAEGKIRQERPQDIVIRLRGADLARGRFGVNVTASSFPNDRMRDWLVRLCALANRAIAQRIGWAGTDDKITLIEAAELDGFRRRNLVSCLADRLSSLVTEGTIKKTAIVDEVEMLKRQNSRIWFVIDDLDATFQNTEEELLELGTFFSAARYMIQDMDGINFRVAMRADVWPLTRRFDESQDKLNQYVFEIEWSLEDFREILCKRVLAECRRLGVPCPAEANYLSGSDWKAAVLRMIMESDMQWGFKVVPNFQVLFTLSYERPRWGIQLCKLAQQHAVRHGKSIIIKADIDDIWAQYGMMRIADLVAEHKHQCRSVEDLVLAFRSAPRQMSRDALFEWINNRVLSHVPVMIEGRQVGSPREVAAFLYRIGFIVARSDDDAGYEHYTYNYMSDLLTTRTNEDFDTTWEIHPCYREALDIEKVARSHRARFGERRRRD